MILLIETFTVYTERVLKELASDSISSLACKNLGVSSLVPEFVTLPSDGFIQEDPEQLLHRCLG